METSNIFLMISGFLWFVFLFIISQILIKNKYKVDKNRISINNILFYVSFIKTLSKGKKRTRLLFVGVFTILLSFSTICLMIWNVLRMVDVLD